MSCRIEACVECTRKCLRYHGKKRTSSPSVAKFFKVMIGDQFLKVLYIPPKFAPMVSALISQSTFLEDSNGEKWEAKISKVNGSFAFQQGWQSFASGHGLEVGDFLVFYYITGSHFVVDIYDKSGCQKLDFPVNRSQKKRGTGSRNYTDQDSTHHTVDIDSKSKQNPIILAVSGSDIEISESEFEVDVAELKMERENNLNCEMVKRPQPVSKAHDMEDTNYIISREIGNQQGEDRHILYDLSQFEMLGNNSGIDESNKGIVGDVRYHTDTSAKLHIEDGLVNKDSVIEEVRTGAVTLTVSKFELMEKKNHASLIDKLAAVSDKDSCNKIAGHPLTATSATKPIRDEENCTDMSNQIQRTDNSVSSEILNIEKKDPPEVTPERCSDWDTVQESCGKTTETINKESTEMTQAFHVEAIQEIFDAEEVTKVMEKGHGQSSSMFIEDNDEVRVKSEIVDLVSSPHHDSTNMSWLMSSVNVNETFLELPSCLPSSSSFKAKMGIKRKVVLLKDPVMRVWPVLYLERYGVNLLTSGWEAFRKANNIGAGDTCVFGIEDESKSICAVHVIRK